MKKTTKFLILCGILIGIGITLQATGYALGGRVTGFGFGADGLQVYTPQNNTYDYTHEYVEDDISLDSFSTIEAKIKYADFKITPSDHYGISYKHHPRHTVSYDVTNGILTINQNITGSSVYEFNWVFIGPANYYEETEYIEIFVPRDVLLNTVSVNSNSGDIQFSDFSAADIAIYSSYGDLKMNNIETAGLDLSLDSGDIEMQDVTSDELTVSDDYGSLKLDGVHVNETCTLVLSSGNVDINNSYFHTLDAKNSYGSMNGSAVTCRDFRLNASSGDCNMNNFTVNNVDILSDYGNVSMKLTAPLSEYNYDMATDYGDVFLDDNRYEENISHSSSSSNQISIDCSSGDIRVNGS